MRPFLHHSPGSITFGVYPLFGLALDWKDAADGRTWIRPRLYRIRY